MLRKTQFCPQTGCADIVRLHARAVHFGELKMTDRRIPAPGTPFNFAEHLIQLNQGRSQKLAYIDDRSELSYGKLADSIQRMAAALLSSGLRREERILILMHDSCDWPVAFLGALYAGAVPVAVNTLLTVSDYRYILEDSRANFAIVSAALLPTLNAAFESSEIAADTIIVSGDADALPENATSFSAFLNAAKPMESAVGTHPDEPGFWLYSSGSTGQPKGAVHTHANLYWTAELYGKGVLGIAQDDTCFSAAKLFFAYGLGNALSFPLSVGATVVLMAERPTPAAVFDRWTRLQPTVFFGAPTGFAGMLASPDLPSKEDVSLRLASSAGEALPADIGHRFTERFGVEIIDGIGSTEMLHIYLSNQPGNVRYGTTGFPVPEYAIELRNDDGSLTPDGEIGELYVKGPSAALMYWNNREKSRTTFQGAWTKSGDKYIRNSNGTYTYSGRTDDMLKVSGVYVSPFEVESTLVQHPAVLEAAVIGHIDADGLTKTKAYVVLQEGSNAESDELKSFVKDKIAPYKYPRIVEFIDALPKTATGKIQRFRLREFDRSESA